MDPTKTKLAYTCTDCGAVASKWSGQCGDCGAWNTLSEGLITPRSAAHTAAAKRLQGYAGVELLQEATPLSAIPQTEDVRLSTELLELDRVLGGGIVLGSAVLIGGDPGIGKSTVLLQMLANLAVHHKTLYVTGEESLQQVSLRAHRLGVGDSPMHLLAETAVERIIDIAKAQGAAIVVVDSIQTIVTETLASAPGSVSQVRESAAQLVRFAKQSGVALFLVGHVTKEGSLAGPRVLEHMVDTVLYFEGESDSRFRLIRAFKNRFGAVNELGIFAMTDRGLKAVSNPSAIFLSHYEQPIAGSLVTVTWIGSRPMLIEVQALVDESHLANPRRVTVGLEQNRLALALAVLHRHCGVITWNQDVFVNIVGGVRVSETAADLPMLLAVVSSLKDRVLPHDWVVFGEVGLAGEIRPVQSGQERLKEIAKHGFKRAIVPAGNAPKHAIPGIEITPVKHLREALDLL
jgi:DNA repair protein RadA/Sms